MKILIIISVRMALAEPGDVQEYWITALNNQTQLIESLTTTDKRFYNLHRGECVKASPLTKDRVYYSGRC